MADPGDVRDTLLDRRQRLEAALLAVADPDPLRSLLKEVDATLERIDQGTYGLCETCRDPIEPDRLAADPLLRFCLDHLTPAQQLALQADLDLTSRIQSELLPRRQLVHDGWQAAYHYEPIGPVSGDYCDLLTPEGGGLFFAVGDVAGKGVAASLLMAHLHALFRSLVSLGLPLRELVERANRLFSESTRGERYATLVCGRTGPEGAVEICNAGHCPPVHLGRKGTVPVPPGGVPIGLFGGAPYAVSALRIGPGETLLVYTDGVTEARDRAGEEFGAERLAQAALARRELPPLDLVRGCLDELARFRAGTPRADDLTLLALSRTA